MNQKNRSRFTYFTILSLGFLLAACASSSYINVRYQLPAATGQLKGKVVSLGFKDLRANKDILGVTAQNDFKNFSGLFSLTLAEENAEEKILGAFNLESLFMEAFRKRLMTLGVNVAPPAKDIPVIEMGLKDFFIDYRGRQWITSVSIQARMIVNTGKTATESVNIIGERYKTLGKSNVEKHLSEIFSECLNKLDIDKLFLKTAM